ncbi:MAG: D-2-hydroxyacid dehydrogenase [Vibrio sp.]
MNECLYILSDQEETYLNLIANSSLKETLSLTKQREEATIVLADPPLLAKNMAQFPNLKWAQSTFAGIDTLMAKDLTGKELRKDYQLTNIKGIFGQLISEYVLGYTLSYFRHFNLYRHQQQNQVWEEHGYQSVEGKCMVILGTGSIGQHLSHTATALGFKVIGVNRSGITPTDAKFVECYAIDQLEKAMQKADLVVNALPSTAQTKQILNAQSLSHCNKALLFNIGRGNAVDDDGLLHALEKGWVEHAFLDVFPVEPLPQTSPYWQHKKVTLTPHIAATSFPEQIFGIFAENVQRYFSGQPLINQIDFDRGY